MSGRVLSAAGWGRSGRDSAYVVSGVGGTGSRVARSNATRAIEVDPYEHTTLGILIDGGLY